MRDWRRGLALLLMVVGVVGCSQKGFKQNLHIQTSAVAGAEYGSYGSWNFARPTEYPITGIQDLDKPEFRADLAKQVTRDMAARGYVRQDSDADLLLAFHVVVENKFDEQVMNDVYAGYDMAWTHVNSESTWQEGTLMIFAIDGKTGAQVWTGTARAEIDEYATYDTRKGRVLGVVSQMLAELPMGTAPVESAE